MLVTMFAMYYVRHVPNMGGVEIWCFRVVLLFSDYLTLKDYQYSQMDKKKKKKSKKNYAINNWLYLELYGK